MLIRTENSKHITEFLKKDLIINLNILGIIENKPEVEIYVDNIKEPKGIVVNKGYFNYVYSKDLSFIEEFVESFNKDGYFGFAAIDTLIADKICEKYEVDWKNPCTLYYLPKENLDLSKIKNKVSDVDIKDVEIVDHFYPFRGDFSIEAITDDILNRPSSAVYVDGEIASWVLTHDDNSLGIMHTKEEHRHKGYAVDVTLDVAAKHIANGKIPYLHIITSNNMSPGLAKKCGFVQYSDVVWFGIKVGNPKED